MEGWKFNFREERQALKDARTRDILIGAGVLAFTLTALLALIYNIPLQ